MFAFKERGWNSLDLRDMLGRHPYWKHWHEHWNECCDQNSTNLWVADADGIIRYFDTSSEKVLHKLVYR